LAGPFGCAVVLTYKKGEFLRADSDQPNQLARHILEMITNQAKVYWVGTKEEFERINK